MVFVVLFFQGSWLMENFMLFLTLLRLPQDRTLPRIERQWHKCQGNASATPGLIRQLYLWDRHLHHKIQSSVSLGASLLHPEASNT